MNPFDLLGFLTTPFTAAAGWAWDTVVGGLTDWVTKGVLSLLLAMWTFMDTSSTPQIGSEWFSGNATSPYRIAVSIGLTTLGIMFVVAVVHGVITGSPSAIVATVGRDLPYAVLSMVLLVAFTAAAVDITDGMSDWIWAQTHDDAITALDGLAQVLATKLPGTQFLGVFVALMMLLAMFVLWVVLFVRESLIYLVVIYAASFGLPAMVFRPLRDTAKKTMELLVALIVAKPVIALALSVGVSALGGVGATRESGDGVGSNLSKEIGTLVTGVVTFGLAAFMPFLVWKLMPIVAAAAVAQGVASGPVRAMQHGMQLQYYSRATMGRLASGGPGGQLSPVATGAGHGPAGGVAGVGGGALGAGGIAGVAVAGQAAARQASGTVASVVDTSTNGAAGGPSSTPVRSWRES